MTDNKKISSDERIGERLRAVRTERDVSLETVSDTLKIPVKYLQGIEDMYVNDIPRGYLNGFLRNYAGFLDLPQDEITTKFAEQCGAISQAPVRSDEIVASNIRTRSTVRGAIAGFAAAVALTLVGGVTLLLINQDKQSAAPITTAETQAPSNGAHDSIFLALDQDAVLPQLPLTLTATNDAWIEVRGADGTIFRSRNMSAGEVYHPRIGAGWSVSARNGGAFVWQVGDVEVGALGEVDVPVYAVDIDAVASYAQTVATPALAAIVDGRPAR